MLGCRLTNQAPQLLPLKLGMTVFGGRDSRCRSFRLEIWKGKNRALHVLIGKTPLLISHPRYPRAGTWLSCPSFPLPIPNYFSSSFLQKPQHFLIFFNIENLQSYTKVKNILNPCILLIQI